MEEKLRMPILINCLSQKTEYSAAITSINTLNEAAATCDYFLMIFIGEQKRRKKRKFDVNHI